MTSHAVPAEPTKQRFSILAFFERAFAAIRAGRQRQADAEIGRMLQLNGGVLTDEVERVIERRFSFRT